MDEGTLLREVPIQIIWPFLIELFIFLLLRCKRSSYIQDISVLSNNFKILIFSAILWVIFFCIVSFKAPKFLILVESKLPIVFLLLLVFMVLNLRNSCLIQDHEDVHLCFLLRVL